MDFEKGNERIKDWATRAVKSMKDTGSQLGIVHRENSPSKKDSLKAMRSKVGYSDGMISRIGISVNRSLIYTHKAVGKGMGGTKGSSWVDAAGNRKKTNPDSLGKAGTGNRKAKPWYNEFMESPAGMEELGDIVAEEQGNAIMNNLLIK